MMVNCVVRRLCSAARRRARYRALGCRLARREARREGERGYEAAGSQRSKEVLTRIARMSVLTLACARDFRLKAEAETHTVDTAVCPN